LDAAELDRDEAWRGLLDPSIPGNILRALEASDAETIGDVAALLDRGEFVTHSGVGPKSREYLIDELEKIAGLGRDEYLYGERGRPGSIGQMVEQGLEMLDERRRFIARRRIYQGMPYRDISPELDVTAQRVEQLMSEAVSELQWRFGDVARSQLDTLIDALRDDVPIVEVAKAPLYLEDEPDVQAASLVFALRLAGLDTIQCWQDRLLTTLSCQEMEEWCDSLVNYLQSQTTIHLSVAHMEAWADANGLRYEQDTLMMLAEYAAGADLSDGPVLPSWTYRREIGAEALWRCGGPAETEDIQRELQKLRDQFPEIPDYDGEGLRALLQQHNAVFNVAHGVYIHAANMPPTRRELREAAQWAASKLEGNSDAVTTHRLLEQMRREATVPEGLTPHLLKTALNRREDVLSLTNTDLVADRASYEDPGENIDDRIRRVLKNVQRPLSLAELTDALARFGYADTSISSAVKEMPRVLSWEDKTYLHWSALSVAPDVLQEAKTAAHERLPEDGVPMSVNQLFEALPPGIRDGLADFHDPVRLLWFLVRSDGGIATSAGRLVARRINPRTNPLKNAVFDILDDTEARAVTIRARLKDEFGYQGNKNTVYATLRVLWKRGALGHEKGGNFWLPE
jgi:hypothetical protein